MKPGTLVKLRNDQSVHYNGVHYNGWGWFNVVHEHVGMYIKTIRKENKPLSDIILIEDKLVEVAPGVMVPLE
jgi:hypothetical protein